MDEQSFSSEETIEKKYGTDQREQCTETDIGRMIAPACEHRGFRNSDVHNKRIIVQRARSDQKSSAINRAQRSIGSATLRNRPGPR